MLTMRSPIEFAETLGSTHEVYNRRGMLLQKSADRHHPQTDRHDISQSGEERFIRKTSCFLETVFTNAPAATLVSVHEWQTVRGKV